MRYNIETDNLVGRWEGFVEMQMQIYPALQYTVDLKQPV